MLPLPPPLSFQPIFSKFPHFLPQPVLLSLSTACLLLFLLSYPLWTVFLTVALMNQIQPQVEPVLEGEEVHSTKAVGEGEEAFTEEYVTGDVTLKEYDYSYRDYNEPLVETGEVDANMGPALSAVTDEGGVSCFAWQ